MSKPLRLEYWWGGQQGTVGSRAGPRFPVYIPSKSRAAVATTPKLLNSMGVSHRIIVEEAQYASYSAVYGPKRLIVLDPAYQRDYDTCDDLGDTRSKGPGPARNFAWDHAIAEGHAWHWVMDDNIQLFARLHKNQRIPVGDGLIFRAMEDFTLRYKNIGEVGPQYWMFVPSRVAAPPFALNRRIFSCNLIRNDLPVRWRGRYNEDLDLAIQVLRAGWCTVQFNAFLQDKVNTQDLPGGNTEEFYRHEGTLAKSQLAVKMHPDIIRLVRRYGRWHHQADFSEFRRLRLIRRDDYDAVVASQRRYETRLIANPGGRS